MKAVEEELGELDFPEEFIFDLWGVMGDVKDGRIWNLCIQLKVMHGFDALVIIM